MAQECTRIEAEISALLDGELPAPEAAAVEAHVRTCPACADLARSLAVVSRTLRATREGAVDGPVSPGFRARVLAAAGVAERAPRAKETAPVRVPAGRLLPMLPAAAAAAASFLAVLAGGAWLGHAVVETGKDGRVAQGPGPVVAPLAPAALLAGAEAHRAAGRPDLERREILAALGVAPDDPAVRAAFARAFGFESTAPGAVVAAGGLAAPPLPAGDETASDSTDASGPDLRVGSLRFSNPGAYDAFTAFRERSRGLEMEVASRGDVAVADPVTVPTDRPGIAPSDPLARLLASLSVGSASGGDGSASYQGITVFPLRFEGAVADAAGGTALPLSLPSALESGRAVVRDGPGRSVATVLVSNLDAERSLLVLAGEVLEGGRADRLVARDVLVAPGARNVAVPVYDAEAGRGSDHPYGSRFRTVAGVAGARVRGLALGQARPEEMRAFLRERLDLLDVTSRLHRSLADAWSERGAAAPVLRTVRPRLAEPMRSLQGADVVGFAVAQGRDVLGIEVFGSHELMLREAHRILEGCAIEASTYPGGGLPPAPAEVARLLAAAGRGISFRAGEGNPGEIGFVARTARGIGGDLLGSGVASGGAILHASVLPGGPGGAGSVRGERSGDGPDAGDQPPAGAAPGEDVPAPGPGGGGEGGSSGHPSTGDGSDPGKRSEPPSPSGDRPR